MKELLENLINDINVCKCMSELGQKDLLPLNTTLQKIHKIYESYEELGNNNTWINVKEQTPKEDERVLLFHDGHINLGRYGYSPYDHLKERGENYWGNNMDYDGDEGIVEPTHWMKLPNKP